MELSNLIDSTDLTKHSAATCRPRVFLDEVLTEVCGAESSVAYPDGQTQTGRADGQNQLSEKDQVMGRKSYLWLTSDFCIAALSGDKLYPMLC